MKELGVVKVLEVMIDNGFKRDRRFRSDERVRDGDGVMNYGGYRSDKRVRGDDGVVVDWDLGSEDRDLSDGGVKRVKEIRWWRWSIDDSWVRVRKEL